MHDTKDNNRVVVEVKENQEEVAFEEMMRRQYNGTKFDTMQWRSIQYNTIYMATIAIKNDISRWG